MSTTNTPVKLSRECEVIEIPSGTHSKLPAGAEVRVLQFLGSSYTIASDYGMFRIDVKDADAIGLTPSAPATGSEDQSKQEFSEKLVWDQLKTVFDPEIPVNIADLGLIYACDITPIDSGDHRIDIKMSMTAPGCGMGNVLKADVESKLNSLPTVKQVNVEIVFEPPWGPALMSEAARLQLGFDL
ncbi:MAG: putative Fe-S cluster assembly protein SufT [Candidatus Acidiferrales bacterium]